MKQMLFKKITLLTFAVCCLTASLLAQNEKVEKTEKSEKTEKREKNNYQQITITRNGDKEEKTVIEINGDKVKVNGKDVADLKDVQVRINNINGWVKGLNDGRNNFNFSFDDREAASTLFSENANRAMLGVVTDADDKGVRVESVSKDGAADKAGLKKNDVITKIDDKKIGTPDDLTTIVRSHKPGDKLNLVFLRDGKEQKVTADLGKWKGMTSVLASGPGLNPFPKAPGVDVQGWPRMNNGAGNIPRMPRVQWDLFSDNASKLGLSVQDTDDGKGVKVLDVDEDGNAAKAGINEDDIITQLDDKAVNGADEIARLMKEKKSQATVRFGITRAGKLQTIEVKVPRKVKTVDL